MPAPKREERKIALEWMGMSTKERWGKGKPTTAQDMRKALGVKASTWSGWEAQYAEQKPRDVYMSSHPMVTGEKPKEVEVVEPDYDSEAYLNEKTEVVDKALVEACDNNNAQALKIYYQLTKRLIEQKEVKIGLTADELTRRNLEADRQLREGGYRVEEVQKKPTLLSE